MEEVSLTAVILGGLSVVLLVAANAFFVAAEFALVGSRATRLESLAQQGDKKATFAYRAVQSLDRYISATQLGITLSSLGLGWIGERTVAHTLEGVFVGMAAPLNVIGQHTVATVIAFTLITILHIVLGELAPKALALLYPEDTSRWVAAPLIAFTIATNPFIHVLNGSANGVLRLVGLKPPSSHERVHQPEEIVMLVKQSQEEGHLAHEDVELIRGVFEFTEKVARDVMTPRTDVQGLDASLTVEDATERIRAVGRSRYPVIEGSLDNIVGIIHAKDILAALPESRFQKLTAVMRPDPLFVPGSREVEDVLADMKRVKQHLAVILDEYGGTAGIVTMEDILEEIVGHIYDEYDAPTEDDGTGDGRVVAGNLDIDDANELYGLDLPTDQHQTVGGYVFGTLGRLPRVGDTVKLPNARLRVMEMDGRRIATLRIIRRDPPVTEPTAAPDASA